MARPYAVAVVLGSVRPGNFTAKAARLVIDAFEQAGVAVDTIDPAELDLALPGLPGGEATAAQLRERIAAATGVVLATPEYHGSYSSTIKLVIDNLGFPSALAGKPVALLGVAAGSIGAIKATEHLRSVGSHIGALVLPGPVSVAGVGKLFDDTGRCLDESVERRIRGLATGLIDYIEGSICPRLALEAMVREAA